MAEKRYVVSEETKKRCRIVPLNDDVRKRLAPISTELFHFFFEVRDPGFSIFVKTSNELIEYIRSAEFSKPLLKRLWLAMERDRSGMQVCILRKDLQRFNSLLQFVRQNKFRRLVKECPELDEKTLHAFADLSSASQLLVRGGLGKYTIEFAKKTAGSLVLSQLQSDESIATLSRMVEKDPTLYDHSASVAMLAAVVARHNGIRSIGEEEMQTIVQCGLFHDVGKSFIPGGVLNKPGKFTDDEYEIMKKHTVFGYKEIMRSSENGAPIEAIAGIVALEHHERFAGIGYPYQKRGRAEDDAENGIHLYSRIVAVADVYSAMLMKRVYKESMLPSAAIDAMSKLASEHFDPLVFEPFAENVYQSIEMMRKKVSNRYGRVVMIGEDDSFAGAILDLKRTADSA